MGQIAADEAYKLEPNLPQAHLELAFKAVGRLDWKEAEEEFALARALGLGGDEMGQYAYLLVNTGHIRRARDLFLVSRASDPLNSNLFLFLLVTFDILDDTKNGTEFYDRGKALFPEWPRRFRCAHSVVGPAGLRRRARQSDREGFPGPRVCSHKPGVRLSSRCSEALEGLYPSAGGPLNLLAIAACAAFSGHRTLAAQALVDASTAVPYYAHKFWQPLFSEVRKLLEFKSFMRTHGFLDYWQHYGWPDQCRADGTDFTCD